MKEYFDKEGDNCSEERARSLLAPTGAAQKWLSARAPAVIEGRCSHSTTTLCALIERPPKGRLSHLSPLSQLSHRVFYSTGTD